MKLLLWFILLLVIVGIVLWYLTRNGQSLSAEFERRTKSQFASDKTSSQPIVTEAIIAHHPAPVQRYMHMTGSIGKPRIVNIRMTFDAEMFQKPGQKGMLGPIEQYERFDLPKRLFFMQTHMYGLPVEVLHDYEAVNAKMQVRLASLFNVVDIDSTKNNKELARTETVTVLNDLCFYAPSWLVDNRLSWRPIDDRTSEVTFTNGPHTVTATLYFNADDELVNFISEDRGALLDDGTLKIMKWSTPLRNYRDFDGRKYATEGEAIWHYPAGEFVYGRMKLTSIK
jgi:hypothetical protein